MIGDGTKIYMAFKMFATISTGVPVSIRLINFHTKAHFTKRPTLPIPVALIRNISVQQQNNNKMVDPKRVVSYEDMLKVIHQPEKVIIDVRNPDEVSATGKIPSSINIPLNTMQDALTSMTDDDFKKHFQRRKPNSSDELIFYCQSGRRSSEALDKALKLGYSNSKTYLGSWNDWSSRQK